MLGEVERDQLDLVRVRVRVRVGARNRVRVGGRVRVRVRVRELDRARPADEHVLRLEVPVEHEVRVAVVQPAQDL